MEKRDNLVKIRLEVSGRVVKNFQKKLQLVGKKRRLTFVSVVIKTLKNIPKIYGGFENFIEFDCWMPTFFSSYISVINTIDCDEKLENVKLINPNNISILISIYILLYLYYLFPVHYFSIYIILFYLALLTHYDYFIAESYNKACDI